MNINSIISTIGCGKYYNIIITHLKIIYKIRRVKFSRILALRIDYYLPFKTTVFFYRMIEPETTNFTQKDEQQPETSSTRIAKYSNRPFPPFMRSCPVLWFFQIEAIFSLSDVTDDRDKFVDIMCQLELEVLSYVKDIFDLPDEEQTYALLKKRLIAVFSDLETKRLQDQIKKLKIDGKKPSELLREMRVFAANRITEAKMRALWLKKLPLKMQAILAVSDMSLTELSVQADKISDVLLSSEENAENAKLMTELIRSVNGLFRQVRNLSNTIRHETTGRSPARLCYFHKTFGAKATRCKKNCSFQSKMMSNNE